MRRRTHVIWGGGYMCMRYLEQTACLFAAKMLFVNEEEDTCHTRRRILFAAKDSTCHMRRRTHVIWGGGHMSYEEEDTCHMRRRIHVYELRIVVPQWTFI
jgi:hypothetical protein